jgi:hypothetical protein
LSTLVEPVSVPVTDREPVLVELKAGEGKLCAAAMLPLNAKNKTSFVKNFIVSAFKI